MFVCFISEDLLANSIKIAMLEYVIIGGSLQVTQKEIYHEEKLHIFFVSIGIIYKTYRIYILFVANTALEYKPICSIHWHDYNSCHPLVNTPKMHHLKLQLHFMFSQGWIIWCDMFDRISLCYL